MILEIRHSTTFTYSEPVRAILNEVRLHPTETPDQRLLDFRLASEPDASWAAYETAGGTVHFGTVRGLTSVLTITMNTVVDTHEPRGTRQIEWLTEDLGSGSESRDLEVLRALKSTPKTALPPGAQAWVAPVAVQNSACAVRDLLQLVHDAFAYRADVTAVETTAAEFWELRAGVCQDFAHFFAGACRHLGIPARYVSGYLHVPDDDVSSRGAHASHAWVECWLGPAGWVGVDPTNSVFVDERYVPVHCGLDYGEAMPIRGLYQGRASSTLSVEVRVEELTTAPSPL